MSNLKENNKVVLSSMQEITEQDRIEIIEDGLRKKYLARLSEMDIVPIEELLPLQEDLIDNVRLFHISEMVYEKGELATDKFTTVFNTLATYRASVFVIIDSDGEHAEFYIGVRNNEEEKDKKRSSVTIGDTLRNTLIGNFPGIKIQSKDRNNITRLSKRILEGRNIASVSVAGSPKTNNDETNEQFIQGLEKLILAMHGRKYIGIIVAENQSQQAIQLLRNDYQDLYTKLSPYQKVQFSNAYSKTTGRSKSFSEMNSKQKAAMIGGAALSLVGVIGGAVAGAGAKAKAIGAVGGTMIGGQIAGQFNGLINSFAPIEQITEGETTTTSSTTENKKITDLMQLIDDSIKRTNEFDSYGMWNVAGYFISDDMSAAEIAASNYRSLMNGESSGRELSAINTWRANSMTDNEGYISLATYLSRFQHPQFYYGDDHSIKTSAATAISGKELGLHIGLPRATTPGLPVIEHAEFGKEVNSYNLFSKEVSVRPEDRMTLGKVFDLGHITNKIVELDNRSLNMHTFITGSTGSGKSNTVYQMLNELHQDQIPFLVVEPAKGEYKDVFGSWDDVNVFSTNPSVAKLININPFMFPESIHVLEHIDGLVEIFSVCWPMYDAMPAFFKDAILRSYETVGWDLGSSTFEGDELHYPDFEILAEQLDKLIGESDYASDIKSNYRGALITRVKSLAVGLNKFIFTREQTPYEILFDQNCILDISRVKSSETKALIMGLMVYILNEYRIDRKTASNIGLKHVTVLEEAHNLLKNKVGIETDLVGKSVEMLTQTIAEIRTYGEGFIIVDQSPSSVDIAAIKNTNTKIVLRTPEANDREAVGRSMGLTEDQVNEIAKLPSGVAVVYQNDWISPVLTMIDKANVQEKPYNNEQVEIIKPLKQARTEILMALMQPWLKKERIRKLELKQALKVIDLKREERRTIEGYLDDYAFLGGTLFWNVSDILQLQYCIKALLYISESEFNEILVSGADDTLRRLVKDRTTGLDDLGIEEVCNVLTKVVE